MSLAAPTPAPTGGPLLTVEGLGKSFGPVAVLQDIAFDIKSGEVHAVIGENGAGKSTLMKILAGHLAPSAGRMIMHGAPIRFSGPVDAERHGIVLVHQEILLAPHLTVAENLFLGREPRRGLPGGFSVDDRSQNRQAAEAVRALGAEIDPTTVVALLSIAQRQLVQIARALLMPHSLVIFDEPTASLTPIETDALLNVIRDIRAKGVAVLYVSHRLPEVKTIADRVTVLRDGRLIGTHAAAALEPLDMARMMVGRDMANLYPPRPPMPDGEPVLDVRNATVPGYAADASFTLRRGEILGFAGLVGAGRTELLEGMLGLRPGQGEIRRNGKPVRFTTVRDSMAAGIVYLSEDRKGKGLLLAQDLRINLTLAALKHFTRGPVIDTAREWQALDKAIVDFDVRTRRKDLLAGQLSGGNQQKLLLGKMMLLEPEIVVIDEPTRGIDIGTKEQIYRFIAALAAQGKSVIVISSEMQELIGVCHRILVMRSGRIVGEVTGDAMTEDEIVTYATGVRTTNPAERPAGEA